MNEQPALDQLSMKDLRQMAGEHQIQNRHRLAKDDLIQALQSALATRVQDEPAAAPLASLAAGQASSQGTIIFAPTATSAEPEEIGPDQAAAVNAEPEVLDASAVAALTEASPVAVPGEAPRGDEPGEPGEGERRRRRRRRRRGRGRGQGEADQTQDGQPANGESDGDDDVDERVEAPSAPVAVTTESAPAPVITAAATAPAGQVEPVVAAPAASIVASETSPAVSGAEQPRNPQRPRDQPRDQQRDQQRDPQRDQQRDQQPSSPRPQGPARPRLAGMQRPVASVLDRLKTFTAGILELCDPSTPSWAQARLGELLAEAGLSPIPCTGEPHADFHRVVGSVVAAQIPAGHIAEVTVPGFALRGDRGDLFPLRRSDVRLSGAAESRADLNAIVRPAAPVMPAPMTLAAPVAVAVAERQAEIQSEAQATPAAPREERRRDERAPRDGRRRDGRRDEPRRDRPTDDAAQELPVPANDADTAESTAPAPVAEVRVPVPSPGRPPERAHRREEPSTAPMLPLAARVADELAREPKAEGFRPLGLNDQILVDLAAIGFSQPTPIQTASIPVALTGRDLIGQAQTGTGKTAAYALPILQRLYAMEGEGPVALILCPTRELARQVYEAFTKMAGASGARATVIYGGASMDEQFRALERKPHVVIGTPGRIIDHMKRRTLDLSRLSVAVLDEADQMLDIGFWPDVMYIMGHTPPTRQLMLFSATFPDPIREMAEKHMKDPERIRIEPERVTVDLVDQKFIAVPHDQKTRLLAHFIETFNPPQLVVFCRTKHQTDRVAEVLKRKNMSAGAIHGDLPQSKRERTLSDFRAGTLQCLVATNVAARGLDIPSVSHVVNYDIPEAPEEYVHRIGRTARNGATGVARTFITPEDGQFLTEIEKHIGLLLEEEKVEGFEPPAPPAAKPLIESGTVGGPRMLKPFSGGIRLGRRR